MPDVFSKLKIGNTSYVVKDSAARSDILALTAEVSDKVPKTRTVNGKALSANITINAEDVPITPITGITGDDAQDAFSNLNTRVSALESTPPSGLSASYDSTAEKLIFSV